jgi:hypothetical protein
MSSMNKNDGPGKDPSVKLSDTGFSEQVPAQNLFVASRELPNDSGEFTATTHVVNTGVESTAQVVNPISMMTGITDNASMGTAQDIMTFLAKPYPLRTGSFSTTDTVSTFNIDSIPSALIQIPIFLNKLKGFLGIRATMVFRLQVNANRFQQGRYILAWTPVCGASTGVPAVGQWFFTHNHTLTQRTQLPHVELDLSTDTQAILKVPFISVYSHAPIVSTGSYANTGYIQITPYSPLVAPAGSTIASYTLWASFEDVELVGAVVPQMGRAFRTKVVPKSKTASEQEQEDAGVGPVQSSMRVVSKVASFVGTNIPFLSEIAAPVSWAANIVGGVASIFGWARPIVLNAPERRKIEIFPYATTMDSADTAAPLSLSARNNVEVLPGFAGTDIDEMSIPFLVSIPAYWQTLTWSTSATNGSSLATWPMSPVYFNNVTTSVGGSSVNNFLPLAFLANMFALWRGSVVLTFKLVKTEFHSGRLLLAFNPDPGNGTSGGATFNLTDTSYVYREIIDVREGNEFSFTIPWTSLTSYKNTATGDNIYGYVQLFVLDELVAPATVSSNISILVEVSGAKDFEFAVPRPTTMSPVIGVVAQMADGFVPKPQPNPSNVHSGIIGGSKVCEDELVNSRMAIGERILSLRSLLRSSSLLIQNPTNVVTRYTNILPYTLFYCNGTGTLAQPPVCGDYYSVIGSCYALSRGGVRWRAYDSLDNNHFQATTYLANLGTYTGLGFSYDATDINGGTNLLTRNNSPFVIQNWQHTGGLEVAVPQYNKYHSRPHANYFSAPASGGTTINLTTSDSSAKFGIFTDTGSTPSNPLTFMRSMSDDGNFGMFVSIPPMVVIPTAL